MAAEKTVRQHYNITDEDMDMLADLAELSYYWENSEEFLRGRLDNPVSGMSDSQTAWIEKILEAIQK